MSREWIDYQNIHIKGEYNRTIVRLKEEELEYLKRITIALEKLEEIEGIHEKLEHMNRLKEQELQQQMFFIELIEECLPIDDARKRQIHQKTIRRL